MRVRVFCESSRTDAPLAPMTNPAARSVTRSCAAGSPPSGSRSWSHSASTTRCSSSATPSPARREPLGPTLGGESRGAASPLEDSTLAASSEKNAPRAEACVWVFWVWVSVHARGQRRGGA